MACQFSRGWLPRGGSEFRLGPDTKAGVARADTVVGFRAALQQPHFNMFNMARNHGSVIAVLPAAPDGGRWSAATYPQGFHSLAATFAEVVAGRTADDAGQEVLLFCRLVGVIRVLCTLLVVAGLTSLPVLRHNFFVTLPLVAIVSTAWVVGPGAIPKFGAFPDFGLGVALCVACVAIVQLRRVIHPALASTALILALAGVAHGWILLLDLCLPSAVVYGWHLFRHRAQSGTAAAYRHSLSPGCSAPPPLWPRSGNCWAGLPGMFSTLLAV